MPPGTKRAMAKGLEQVRRGEDDEAINYFVDILPRMRSAFGAQLPIVEFIQQPGETVFVPGGWWHAVLNLDDTVAVTQVGCAFAILPDSLVLFVFSDGLACLHSC